MANIFDYQQKRILVDKLLDYIDGFKVSTKTNTNNQLKLTINKEEFTINQLPTYTKDSKKKLAR